MTSIVNGDVLLGHYFNEGSGGHESSLALGRRRCPLSGKFDKHTHPFNKF